LSDVLDVPGGPASGENHEISPIAVLGNRYHLNVVSFDLRQNLLDLQQIQKAFTAVNGGQRAKPYLLLPWLMKKKGLWISQTRSTSEKSPHSSSTIKSGQSEWVCGEFMPFVILRRRFHFLFFSFCFLFHCSILIFNFSSVVVRVQFG